MECRAPFFILQQSMQFSKLSRFCSQHGFLGSNLGIGFGLGGVGFGVGVGVGLGGRLCIPTEDLADQLRLVVRCQHRRKGRDRQRGGIPTADLPV
jgi:hypothetical protein